jgi:hypothetical protein
MSEPLAAGSLVLRGKCLVLLAGFGNTKKGRKELGKEGRRREKEKGKGRESEEFSFSPVSAGEPRGKANTSFT